MADRPRRSKARSGKRCSGTNLNFRDPTLTVIGLCKETAKPAVPALLELARSGEFYVREEAVSALQRIDPDAAAREGLK